MWKLGISKVGVALAAVVVGVFSPPLHARSCDEFVKPARHLYSLNGHITNNPIRHLEALTTLKVTTHNTLQLRLVRDEYSADFGVKSVKHVVALGQTHHRIDSDVLFLQEVEGVQTASLFAKRYLGDAYVAVTYSNVHGKEISNTILVKKNLFAHFRFAQIGLPILKWTDPAHPQRRTHLFHREPIVVAMSRKIKPDDRSVDFIFVNWHLKSQKNRNGDPRSERLRAEQVKGVIELQKVLQARYPNSMIIHGGDFNGSFQEDPVLRPLHRFLTDAFQVSHNHEEEVDTTINWHVAGQAQLNSERVDGFFVSQAHHQFVEFSETIPLFTARGVRTELPANVHELHSQASDHRPFAMTIDLAAYFAQRR